MAASTVPHPCSREPMCALPSVSASRSSHRAEASLPRSVVVPGPSLLAPSLLAPSSLTRCHAGGGRLREERAHVRAALLGALE